MSGIDLVVDTNLLINLAEGQPGADHYLTGNKLFVSVITEIEIFGWHKISNEHKIFFNALLKDCKIVELDIPLLTYDLGFEKIKSLNVILLN